MEFVVTSDEMRKCDSAAIRELGLSVELLMEHAGLGVVGALERRYGPLKGRAAVILCGKGNNGGDGLVAGRLLALKGVAVTVVLCHSMKELSPPTRRQAGRFVKLLRVAGLSRSCRLIKRASAGAFTMLPEPDFVVDALFGTGFSGKPKGVHARAIDWMNNSGGRKIAVDLPSGLNADSGAALGRVVSADLTTTFHEKKIGLIIGEGSRYAGIVEVVDIGIPAGITSRHSPRALIVEGQDVRGWLPVRPRTAHKHSVGKVLVVAGSVGMAGAAAMTAQSALRAGAGVVVLCAPRSLYSVLSRKLTEVMVMPLSESPFGTISAAAMPELAPHLAWADVCAIGPGLSTSREAVSAIRALAAVVPSKLLLDADGINAFRGHPELLLERRCSDMVLTPHAGEMSRLSGVPAREIGESRLDTAREFARRYGLTLVLKGAPTLTAAPSGAVFVNSTGNPGMATAGSGDVLTGILAGLWAQGMASREASAAAVYLHGMAGDLAASRLGERSLLALDMLEELPRAMLALETIVGTHVG